MSSFNGFRVSRIMTRMLVAALFSTPLWANIYIVDSAGGGQFTDIQSAITFAQAGDVILVHTGNYGAFTLDKGLVIIGYGYVVVAGTTQIVNVSAGQRAAVVHLNPSNIDISGCAGAIVLQDMSGIGTLAVLQSNDVRIAQVEAVGGVLVLDAMTTDTARVEVVDSTLHCGPAPEGGYQGGPTHAPNGGRALAAAPSSRVHAARSTFDGGRGGDAVTNGPGGNGGAGMSLAAPSEVFLVGPASHVEGGTGGWALYAMYNVCVFDGGGACGVTGAGDVHYSGAVILGAYTNQYQQCSFGGQDWGFDMPAFCGPNVFAVSPADPSLRLTGYPTAGAMLTFTVYGEPGASAVLNLGHNLILVATPGVDIERLAPSNRVIPLGVIPASGSIMRNIPLPASFTPGLLFVAQAEVTGTTGLRRTNSTPIVVR